MAHIGLPKCKVGLRVAMVVWVLTEMGIPLVFGVDSQGTAGVAAWHSVLEAT